MMSAHYEDLQGIIEKHEKTLEHYKDRFHFLCDIQAGDKLMKAEDASGSEYYYLVQSGLTQGIRRYWASECRENTKQYLTDEFRDFSSFLDIILKRCKTHYYYFSFKQCVDNICLFIGQIITGLYAFKTTYSDHKEIQATVDSIILTLIDFKNKVNGLKKKPKTYMKIKQSTHNRKNPKRQSI